MGVPIHTCFASSLRKLCFREKKEMVILGQSPQNGLKRQKNMMFS